MPKTYHSQPNLLGDGAAVTPSDTTSFSGGSARGLYVGVGGDVAAVMDSGAVLAFKNVPTGAFLPILCSRVNSTGTTATNILALY